MSKWNKIRDAGETAASLAGNYLLPGSSLVTDRIASNGSQGQLGSTLGKLAQFATGAAGSGLGSDFTHIPAASDVGAGWTNAANGVGNLVGAGNLGTNISNGISSATSGLTDALKGGASAVGNATGLSNLFGSGVGAETISPALSAADPSLANSVVSNTGNAGIDKLVNGFSSSPSAGTSLSSALNIGSGGGASSFGGGGGLGLAAALAGGANSMYANNQAQKDLVNSGNAANALLQPYEASGVGANAKLSDLLGTSGNAGASGYGSLGQTFSPGDLTKDPGYQFQLQQGQQALDRKNSATGNMFSGAALKEAQDYGQGLAGTTYNNAYQRYLQQQQQQYGMLSGQNNTGLNAAGTAGNIDTSIGSARAGAGIGSSNITNQTLSSLLSGRGYAGGVVNIDPLTGRPRVGNYGVMS